MTQRATCSCPPHPRFTWSDIVLPRVRLEPLHSVTTPFNVLVVVQLCIAPLQDGHSTWTWECSLNLNFFLSFRLRTNATSDEGRRPHVLAYPQNQISPWNCIKALHFLPQFLTRTSRRSSNPKPLTTMQFKALTAFSVASILAAATAAPNGGGSSPANQCTTGSLECCNSTGQATDPAISTLLGLLGIDVSDVTALVGVTCSPITVIGAGGTSWYVFPPCGTC